MYALSIPVWGQLNDKIPMSFICISLCQ